MHSPTSRHLARQIGAGVAIAALAFSTVAAEGDPSPVTLTATGSSSGGVTTVSGVATAENPGAESVAGFLTEFADGSALGLNLVDATIEQTETGLHFVWLVDNLAAPAPPELTRYNWSFSIDGETFQLQAKTSNLASVTLPDDPAGHVTNAGASFQVRGNCTDSYQGTPVAGCPHIGWVTGAFDTANNAITMDVPYGFHELIQPGAILVESQSAAMSISASGQAGVSNATISSYINDWGRPYSSGLTVSLVEAEADANPAKLRGGTQLELAEDGAFTGSIEVDSDLVAWVVACTGFTCTGIAIP
ncbi:MAG: hypothetical protein ACI867_001199 [Glaciecola sp.]|jgi:hypothetical protein